MNWSLFLMNQLTEDAVVAQVGEIPFTYIWLLILIALVAWMDLDDYHRMDIKAIEVCKGERYHNLWWFKEAERMVDCSIQFWIYWEELQEEMVKVLILTEEVMTKYQRISCFSIRTHTVYVQAQGDPSKQWTPLRYKVIDVELEAVINSFPIEW